MKSENILKKIINNFKKNNNEMTKLLYDLKASVEKERIKNTEDVIKKISLLHNLDEEQLLKRFLKKNKKVSSLDSETFLSSYIENNEDDLDNEDNEKEEEEDDYDDSEFNKKEQITQIYKKMCIDGNEFFYDEKNNGIVYQRENDTFKTVGVYNLEEKKIIFT
jgi:hypothetical protein